MAAPAPPFRTPYASSPGSSTPGPEMDPKEGRSDLIAFAWLSALNTAIIGIVGVLAWWLWH